MMKPFILSCLLFVACGASAQQKYTDALQRQVAGQGTVVLHEDAEIEALVNGSAEKAASSTSKTTVTPTTKHTSTEKTAKSTETSTKTNQTTASATKKHEAKSTDTSTTTPSKSRKSDSETTTTNPVAQEPDTTISEPTVYTGKRIRMNGFRIQVYSGGNSRDAQSHARQVESRVKMYFPDLTTYTRFVSPRWICHVGDFRTREEAMEKLSEMRETGKFSDAIVVRCKINAIP